VSDDDGSGRGGHVASVSRRQVISPRPPSRNPSVQLAGHFSGDFPNAYWQAAAWSPDGSQLAFGGRTLGGAGVLHVWNGESGRRAGARHLTQDLAGAVISLAWSPDGEELASVELHHMSGRRAVRIRSTADNSREIALPAQGLPAQGLPVAQAAWSPDGTLLALSGPGCGETLLVDSHTGAHRLLLGRMSGPVAFEPEGRLIAGVDGTNVVLCDVVTGQRVRILSGQHHVPAALAWARRGTFLAVADGERILVWDARVGAGRWDLPWSTPAPDRGSDGRVTAIEWLDGGHYLLEFRRTGGAWRDEAGSIVSTVTLWDTADGTWQFAEPASQVSHQGRGPIAATTLAPANPERPVHRRLALALDDTPPVIWAITGDLPHYLP
jgi:WD40 repeat protein